MSMLGNKRVLLIVTGGIAAFKALELVRLIRANGINVRVVLTESGSEFVTPLSIQALTEDKVYTELFSLTDESEMGHIQLSRDADLILVLDDGKLAESGNHDFLMSKNSRYAELWKIQSSEEFN